MSSKCKGKYDEYIDASLTASYVQSCFLQPRTSRKLHSDSICSDDFFSAKDDTSVNSSASEGLSAQEKQTLIPTVPPKHIYIYAGRASAPSSASLKSFSITTEPPYLDGSDSSSSANSSLTATQLLTPTLSSTNLNSMKFPSRISAFDLCAMERYGEGTDIIDGQSSMTQYVNTTHKRATVPHGDSFSSSSSWGQFVDVGYEYEKLEKYRLILARDQVMKKQAVPWYRWW